MYFDETDNGYSLPRLHHTDDILKVIGTKVKVKVRDNIFQKCTCRPINDSRSLSLQLF